MLVNIECENKNGGKTMLMKNKRKAKKLNYLWFAIDCFRFSQNVHEDASLVGYEDMTDDKYLRTFRGLCSRGLLRM